MLSNERLIKMMSIITLVLFIILMVASVLVIVAGIGFTCDIGGALTDVVGSADADNPGSGWLLIGGVFGSLMGGIIGITIIMFGVIIAVVDCLVYLPAFIARCVWKKKRNSRWYWIWTAVWVVEIIVCIVLCMVV